MKPYTDIEQSKKLEGILPIGSNDMFYEPSAGFNTQPSEVRFGNIKYAHPLSIPCWSLAALFGVLPTTIGNFFEKNALRIRMDKGENDFNIWYENFDCGDVAEGLDVKENNPIDACVAMIEKLHEQKLL